MTAWNDASEATVHAANAAMVEVAASGLDADAKRARIAAIWRPVAQALTESIRPGMPTAQPAEWALAKRLGPDFVGQTSDTGRVVSWGEASAFYRAFRIHDTPEANGSTD